MGSRINIYEIEQYEDSWGCPGLGLMGYNELKELMDDMYKKLGVK